jgi:hypothetical protein
MQTLKNLTKYVRHPRKVSNVMSDLQEDDREQWLREYNSGTIPGAGVKHQNIGQYLKKRLRETQEQLGSYKSRARARIHRQNMQRQATQAREAERELARLRQRRLYAPGVEQVLAREHLSLADIDALENPEAGFAQRRQRAPIIQQELLARADAESEAMIARAQRQAAHQGGRRKTAPKKSTRTRKKSTSTRTRKKSTSTRTRKKRKRTQQTKTHH